MAEDWIDDFEEFEPAVLAACCREWRRMNDRRPTIAQLRALCIDEQSSRLPRLPPRILSEAEATELAERWAADSGFASLEAFLASGRSVSVQIGPGNYRRFQGPR